MQDDILNRVLHLIHCSLCTFLTNAQHGIGLIEKQYRSTLTQFDIVAVAVECRFDILFALADPATLDLRDIDDHQISLRAARQLVYRLGLTRSGRSVKEAGKPLAHPVLFQPLLHRRKLFRHQQFRQLFNLPTLTRIIEEPLFGKGGVFKQFLLIFSLLLSDVQIFEQRLLRLVRKFEIIAVYHSVGVAIFDNALALQRAVLSFQFAAQDTKR